MTNVNVRIKFPAILLNNYGASAVSTKKKFETCGEQWVDEKKMNGTKVIDSRGDLFIIENTVKRKHCGIIPSWLIPYSRRVVQVDYELKEQGVLSVEEIKIELLSIPANKKDSEFVDELKTADSIDEIIHSVGID
jgi:hypothetical protein